MPLYFASPYAAYPTPRNESCGSGKYIKLQYDHDFRLVGARTEHFLLEKSRLVHLEESERSYHILYQVSTLPRIPPLYLMALRV